MENVKLGTGYGHFYSFFVSDSEYVLAELGSGYIRNYISNGSLSNGFVTVTQQRAYFNGKAYYKDYGGKFKKQVQEKVVDLKDITGTGFTHLENIGVLVTAIVLAVIPVLLIIFNESIGGYDKVGIAAFIFLLLSVVLFIVYALTIKNLFNIEFAGGSISFDASWYSKESVDTFMRGLRKAMSEIKDTVPTESVTPCKQVTAVDKSEALRECAKLKEEGIIDEEEFKKMKADIISGKG